MCVLHLLSTFDHPYRDYCLSFNIAHTPDLFYGKLTSFNIEYEIEYFRISIHNFTSENTIDRLLRLIQQ